MLGSPVSFKKFASTTVAAACSCATDANARVQFQALQLLGCLCNKHKLYKLQEAFPREILTSICSLMCSPCMRISNHACNALISFCRADGSENCVESDLLLPYLEGILRALGDGPLSSASKVGSVEGAEALMIAGINALACVADVVGREFQPHYASFMPGLLSCVKLGLDEHARPVNPREDSVMAILRGTAIEAASIMGEAVGGNESQDFLRDATSLMHFVLAYLALANQVAMADAASSAPGASPAGRIKMCLPIPMDKVQASCARISGMMGSDFAQFMPSVLPHLLRQVKAKNDMSVTEGDEAGLEATNKGEVERDLDMGTESMTMNIPGVGIKKLTLNTTVIQEKSQAARALYEHGEFLLGALCKSCIAANAADAACPAVCDASI